MSRAVPTYRWLSRQDEALCLCINQASRLHGLRILFRAVGRLGDGIFWYALMVGLLVTQREAAGQPVLQMTLTGLACTLVYKWLKAKTTRARPYQRIHTIHLSADPLDPHSFPSGHTLHAVAFTLIALHHYPGLALALVPFTVLVAFSRIVLGLHYPSDVLAGIGIGVAVASISLLVF